MTRTQVEIDINILLSSEYVVQKCGAFSWYNINKSTQQMCNVITCSGKMVLFPLSFSSLCLSLCMSLSVYAYFLSSAFVCIAVDSCHCRCVCVCYHVTNVGKHFDECFKTKCELYVCMWIVIRFHTDKR